MGLTYAIFSIAVILSLLGAAMAFLITYEEYVHHYPSKREVWKKALEAAGFTFVFFLVLGLLLAIMLPSWF